MQARFLIRHVERGETDREIAGLSERTQRHIKVVERVAVGRQLFRADLVLLGGVFDLATQICNARLRIEAEDARKRRNTRKVARGRGVRRRPHIIHRGVAMNVERADME